MWLLILEALAALVLLGGAVWWTMFSGRRREREREASDTQKGVEGEDEPPAR